MVSAVHHRPPCKNSMRHLLARSRPRVSMEPPTWEAKAASGEEPPTPIAEVESGEEPPKSVAKVKSRELPSASVAGEYSVRCRVQRASCPGVSVW